jgi:hypothetical protein
VTSQPDHSLADEPMADEPLLDGYGPTANVAPEPLPGAPLPADSMPHEHPPAEPLPALSSEATTPDDTTAFDDSVALDSETDVDESDLDESDLDESGLDESGLDEADVVEADVVEETLLDMRATAPSMAPGRLSQQWHDIQAMFVDDPQGSVQRAAQAADAAVAALSESLRQSQAALTPAGMSTDPHRTEELREALREYRLFCERVADLADQLPSAGAMG